MRYGGDTVHVTVGFRYYAGDKIVAEDESRIMGVVHYEVAGKWIPCELAELVADGPFMTLRLSESSEYEGPWLERHSQDVRDLREELTPGDWLEQTTDEVLVLPVSSMEWVDMSLVHA